MKNYCWTAIAVAGALALPGMAGAATPKNALGAIAVSPDGKMIAAAGDNQALYLLDPQSLEVTGRFHIGFNPQDAFFSADGSTLALVDHDGMIHFLSTSDWSDKAVTDKTEAVTLVAGADAILGAQRAQRSSDGVYATPIILYKLSDGSILWQGVVNGQINAIAAAPDGSSFVAITKAATDETEAKEQAPADLKGEDKTLFEQQHDGYTAEIVKLDAKGGEVSRSKTWFSLGSPLTGVHDGESAYFLSYQNVDAKVATDGTLTMFKLDPSYLYGIGASADGTTIAAGSLADGTIYTPASSSAVGYKLDKISGWPEYFKGFAFAPDGSVYAGTTSYRAVHIGADGTVLAAKPVF